MSPDTKIKILTINDESCFLDIIEKHFQKKGYVILKAENSDKGLEVLKKEQPDVVLINHIASENGGFDVASTISAKSPDTLLYIASKNATSGEDAGVLKISIWGVVKKFSQSLQDFENILSRTFEKTRLQKENRRYKAYPKNTPQQLNQPNNSSKNNTTKYLQLNQEIQDRCTSSKNLLKIRAENLQKLNDQLIKELSFRELFEKKLRQSEEKYRSIIENIKEVYYETDLSGRITFLSGNISSVEKEKKLGLNYRNIMDKSNRNRAFRSFYQVFKTGKSEDTVELEVQFENDDKRKFEASVSLLTDSTCNPIGFCGILRDISLRKIKEQKQDLFRNNLECLVKERTDELRNTKIEAEAARLAKSEFMANISHELRTPMHSILSYSKFGMDKIELGDKEKLYRYFNNINSSAQRLMGLLNDLLDLSCLEYDNQSFKMEEYEIFDIVADLVSDFDSILKKNHQYLYIEKPDISTSIVCDRKKIIQVLQHLLSNAIKYSPAEKSIAISFNESELIINDKTVSALKITIADQGIGIPEDELETIFEKFIQSSKSKTGAGGTGLGLAISFQVVKAHYGKIWAERNPEGGTVICMILPFNHSFLIKKDLKN